MHTELLAVADGVRMMATIANDLLDLQKMRTGTFAVSAKAASPRRIVDACVRAGQPAVTVPIEVVADESVPTSVGCARAARWHLVMGLTPAAAAARENAVGL